MVVQTPAEFDYDGGGGVGILRVRDKFSEFIEVVIEGPSALEVSCAFQFIYRRGPGISGEKLAVEDFFEVCPIIKSGSSGQSLLH